VRNDQSRDCRKWNPLLNEFVNETLDENTAAPLRRHLEDCASCSALANDLRAQRSVLRHLSERPLSADFDDRLARRISKLNHDSGRLRWARLASLFSPVVSGYRPALALGMAVIAVCGVIGIRMNAPLSRATPEDMALVTQCIAQHRSYAETQPLSDWSAQNLSSHVDASTPQADSAGPADSDAGTL
jgi:anti-sigma factor RsiW